jgi:hypothetical protein
VLPAAVGEALVPLLHAATSTADDVVYAVWEGWGDVPHERWPGAAVVGDAFRSHLLLRGPLGAASAPLGASGRGQVGAQLWWPRDRAWLVAAEIDLAWTYVAGARPLIGQILSHPDLEALPAAYDDRVDNH